MLLTLQIFIMLTVGRTTPTLDDVGLAFRNMGISLSELEEYVRHVEPLPFAHEIVQFPAPKRSNLQIPKPGHKELLSREEHIEDYMPLLYPTPEGKRAQPLLLPKQIHILIIFIPRPFIWCCR